MKTDLICRKAAVMPVLSRCSRVAIALCALMGSIATAHAEISVSSADRRAQAPGVAVTDDGTVHVVWFDKGAVGEADQKGEMIKGSHHSHQAFADLHYANWALGSDGFSASQRLNAEPGQVWGFSISRPIIAADGAGRVHVMFPGNAKSPETGKSVASTFYTHSEDGGNRFSAPVQLNADPEEDLSALIMGGLAQAQVFGGMAVSPEGTVHAFWLDTRGMTESMRSAVYYRRSENGGAQFGDEVRLLENAQCPCCQVSALAENERSLFLSARQIHGDNIRTPMLFHSEDGGASFGEPVATGGTPWRLEGCPLKLTALAATGSAVHTLVHNGAEEPPGLLYARADLSGTAFEAPIKMHPEAVISDSPAMASSGEVLLAVWHAKAPAQRQIYYRFSLDGGATFLPVQHLPTGDASVGYPSVAATPENDFVIAWQADEVIQVTRIAPPTQALANR